MIELSLDMLQRARGDCRRLRFTLGDLLSSWLFTDDARQQEKLDPPSLPTDTGAVVVLFRRSDSLDFPCIAKGFGLPFRWRCDETPRNSCVPQSMIDESIRIRNMLEKQLQKKDPQFSLQSWWLDLHIGHEGISLRQLPFRCESAAIPLAAGLLLAIRDGRPSTNVLATGAIDNAGYIYSVDGYEEKLAAADALLPSGQKRLFFVPPADFTVARTVASTRDITLKTFDVNRPFYETLDSLLLEMDQPPEPAADLSTHISHANRLHLARNMFQRSDYYKKFIVEKRGEKIAQEQSFAQNLLSQSIEKLLLPVSLFPDNTMLSLAILKPKAVRLVVSGESNKHVDMLREFAQRLGISSEKPFLIPIEKEPISVSQIRELTEWLADCKGQRVVDFTPGTREMLAAVLIAGINSKAKLVYIRHKTLPEINSIQYGTEELVEFIP